MSSTPKPFCHAFRHDDRYYAYDGGTNDVYEIDAALADLLKIQGTGTRQTLIDRLSTRHSREDLERAWRELEASHRDGLFRGEWPRIAGDCGQCVDHAAYESRLNHLCLCITEDCNLRCRYCLHGSGNTWIRPHRRRAMSFDTARRALDLFIARSAGTDQPHITFYGGEPLLEFDLIRDLVDHIRKRPEAREFGFSIATNGTHRSEDIVRFICERGIRLQISLDGPASLHDAYRRSKTGAGSHADVEAFVSALLEADPGIADRISFTATLAPPYDFKSVVDYFEAFPPYIGAGLESAPWVRLNLVSRTGLDLGDERLIEEQLRKGLDWARTRYVDYCTAGRRDELGPVLKSYFDPPLIKFHHRARGFPSGDFHPTGACGPGLRKLYVTADGRLQPCESVGDNLCIGDVESGLDMEAIQDLYSGLYASLGDRCGGCWALRHCTLCFLALAPAWPIPESAAYRIPEELCENIRSEFADMLKLFVVLMAKEGKSLEFLENSLMA